MKQAGWGHERECVCTQRMSVSSKLPVTFLLNKHSPGLALVYKCSQTSSKLGWCCSLFSDYGEKAANTVYLYVYIYIYIYQSSRLRKENIYSKLGYKSSVAERCETQQKEHQVWWRAKGKLYILSLFTTVLIQNHLPPLFFTSPFFTKSNYFSGILHFIFFFFLRANECYGKQSSFQNIYF